MSVKSRPLTTCFSLLEAKEKLHFLQPEKRTLMSFCIKSTSILGYNTGFSLLPTGILPLYFPGFER
jgi:hypothetical protein